MTWKSTGFVPLYNGSIQFNPILAKLWSLILAQMSKLPYFFWLKKVTFYINLYVYRSTFLSFLVKSFLLTFLYNLNSGGIWYT